MTHRISTRAGPHKTIVKVVGRLEPDGFDESVAETIDSPRGKSEATHCKQTT